MNKTSVTYGKMALLAAVVSLLCALTSCGKTGSKDDKDAYAKVGDEVLLREDIKTLIPEGTSQNDSIAIAEAFVKKWITNSLIYEEAKKELGENEEINDMVEEYRKALIIHKYEQNLLDKKFSTQPSEEEMQTFYENNQKLLTVSNPIVRGMSMKIPASRKNIDAARKLMRNAKEGDEDEIDKWSLRNSSVFLYFGKEWSYLSDVARSIPILAGYNPSTILDKNKYLELRDDSFVYIVRISDYRLKGNTEPYEMAKPRIATLILNQRKKDFIKQLENDIYNEGVKNKKITIRK